ncbi:GNAT family N-acetyltransferase [Nonomuraea aridisoli]|uniref:GNAT family N-acetyltransferase n=1 Tax=Nonomuraea aridisoli TaxID=2070368 RepID=A0A2W2E6W1_9ACTN|nr:GNAT family N-acetyltransferase [Nonomuraea aridisoli]PZG18293.1 GNAT family N-acetyltransferase [Nonomuraea aridisoli]
MHRISRPRPDDAAAIHELVATYDTAVIGAPDSTLEDIADELAEPGFDRDKDGWLAHGPGGRLDGWAWAFRKGDSDQVDVEVIVRPGVPGLAEELWRAVLARAAELGEERGHDAVTLDIGVYRADEAKQARVKELGFEPATSYHRMRIDHHGPVEPPAVPAGLTLHSGESEEVRREAHRVHQEGFAEHFGFVPVGYEQWYEHRQASSATDWSQLTLARLDGRPAGLLIGNDQFLSDEGCGYVATLAVLPEFRGRGLGRLLLRHAFAADASRGRKGTILHVDAGNTTPALDLYESAGMRPVMVIDIWRRRL